MKRLTLECCRNLFAERTRSHGDWDALSLGLSQASVSAVCGGLEEWFKRKEKTKQNLSMSLHTHLDSWKRKGKNSNVSLQTHLDSWRLFYRNTEWVRVLALPFEMLNLLNCPVSQFLRDHKVFVRIAKLMLTITLTCLPPSALHFLSMWEIWEKLRRFPGSPSQLAPSGAAQVPLLRLLVLSSTSLCILGFYSL